LLTLTDGLTVAVIDFLEDADSNAAGQADEYRMVVVRIDSEAPGQTCHSTTYSGMGFLIELMEIDCLSRCSE
jgi:hypothetical protein